MQRVYTAVFFSYLVLILSLLCENVSLSKCLISVNDLCLQDLNNVDMITLAMDVPSIVIQI